jgi:cruciform cutting endonuclease 1
MGIKNLAFCVADIPPAKPTLKNPSKPPSVHINTWQRISLLPQPKALQTPNAEPENDSYTPSALSATALSLVKSTLLPHKPSTILIERQRFRSANAAAVQEWTLRVNLLEGMIWAVLRSLGYGEGGEIGVESVNPARVAGFWVQGPGKGKVEKRDKVEIVGKWLEDDSGVRCEGKAERVRGAFLGKLRGVDRVKQRVKMAGFGPAGGANGKEEDIGKLDDLADCLLQVAAWVKWRDNRRVLAGMLDDEKTVVEFLQRCETG